MAQKRKKISPTGLNLQNVKKQKSAYEDIEIESDVKDVDLNSIKVEPESNLSGYLE